MLSDSILEQLSRDTSLRETMVTVAWPDLSVTERLQLMQTIQDGNYFGIATWLVKLAFSDDSPIVRFWAARHFDFDISEYRYSFPDDPKDAMKKEWFTPSEEQLALTEQVLKDPCELVRACLDTREDGLRGGLAWTRLSGVSQLQRLSFIRHQRRLSTHFTAFIDWLDEGIQEGLPDLELGDCALELLRNPKWIEYFNTYDDIDETLYFFGQAMRKGFALIQKAGPILSDVLVCSLPLSIGVNRRPISIGSNEMMSADDFKVIPGNKLRVLLFRSDGDDEIAKLRKMIREHPEDFDQEQIDAVKEKEIDEADGGYFVHDPIASRQYQMKASPARQEAILDVVLNLERQVAELTKMVGELVTSNASRRRGIFG